MRESAVEAELGRQVKRLGGIYVKLAPTQAGLPDRLVLMPGGRAYLVELKTAGGRLRPVQKVWHERARQIGHYVQVLHGAEEVRLWVNQELEGNLPG